MTYGPNLLVGTKWTGETWAAAHPDHEGWVSGSWTEYRPSHLITTCCYGNCEKWPDHGHKATHRWFTPGSALPFLALCKGHAKERRDAGVGHDVVAYSTLIRLSSHATDKQYDAEKTSRYSLMARMSDKVIDRDIERMEMWTDRMIVAGGRAYGLNL
jgi:hypothetical protein